MKKEYRYVSSKRPKSLKNQFLMRLSGFDRILLLSLSAVWWQQPPLGKKVENGAFEKLFSIYMYLVWKNNGYR